MFEAVCELLRGTLKFCAVYNDCVSYARVLRHKRESPR
jgi:hypothetical protein